MSTRSIHLLLLFSLLGTARAEEQVRATQEELRRRNVYFGDIDGRHTPELEEALKRFQHKKGLAASGREDEPTLRTLGLKPRGPNDPPPKELAWPEEPVLKSDTKLDVGAMAKELAGQNGIAPAAVAPPSMQTVPTGSQGSRGSRGTPMRAARPAPADPIAAQRSLSQTEAVDFVKGYLSAMARGDLKREMGYFADRVNYYGNGSVDRRLIEYYLRRYEAKWPSRSYSLARVISQTTNPRTAEITLTYEVKFSLKHKGAEAHGVTLNQIVINAATVSPRIVSVSESRVRR